MLAAVMLAPKTFTREDVVEISTHGGSTASRAVLDTIIRAGAYMAEPGEFTHFHSLRVHFQKKSKT